MPGQSVPPEQPDLLALSDALMESEEARRALREAVTVAGAAAASALGKLQAAEGVVQAAAAWASDPNSVNRCFALMQQVEAWQRGQPS